jgi:3-oxoacyl-[acyl-carrier protein] reductase
VVGKDGDMFDLSGKSALVTGASGGIGGAIARVFHGAGAAVLLTGTRREALDALAASLGDRVFVETCDLGDAEATEALAKEAEARMGAVDILVNNAGRTRDGLFLRMRDEDWAEILEINLSAAFRLTRGCLRGMMKRRAGRIINITSVVGQVGNPGQANYVAAKAGLIGLTKTLAAEVGSRGITVNGIAPGFIETAMTAAVPDERRGEVLKGIPLGRFGTPEEVAAGALFLASDEASYVTGTTLNINGGMAMI